VGMKEKSLEKEIADDRKWMLEQIEAMKDPAYVSELMASENLEFHALRMRRLFDHVG
jgi:hypothetical protein